jgi:hypothetical protein
MLHAQHCRPVACAYYYLAFAFVFEGSRAWAPHWHRVALTAARYSHNSEGGAVLRCEKWRAPEAEPRAPSKKQKQVAESGAALHETKTVALSVRISFVTGSQKKAKPGEQQTPDPKTDHQSQLKQLEARPASAQCTRTGSAQSKRDTHRAVPPALIASLVLIFGAWMVPGASLAATRQPVASCQLPPVCLCWVLVM